MKLTLTVLIATLLLSCSPIMYIPDTVQAPSLIEKGEVELEGSYGTNGVDAGVAVAFTDNIGAQFKGSFLRRSKSSGDYIFRNYVDAGAGYTRVLTEPEEGSKLFFSAFLGGGYGSAEGEETHGEFTLLGASPTYTNYSKGRYFKIWGQPTFGMVGQYVEFSTSFRLNYLEFFELENDFESNPDGLDLDGLKNNLFIEPTFTIKAGSENVKFKGQLTYSQGYYPFDRVQFKNKSMNFNIGICINMFP